MKEWNISRGEINVGNLGEKCAHCGHRVALVKLNWQSAPNSGVSLWLLLEPPCCDHHGGMFGYSIRENKHEDLL